MRAQNTHTQINIIVIPVGFIWSGAEMEYLWWSHVGDMSRG